MVTGVSPISEEEAIKKGLENTKTLLLYAGVPNETDDIEGFKKTGGKIIFFLSSEEKKLYTLKADESGVTWDSDEMVKSFLLDNLGMWVGGQIGGNNEKRVQQLANVVFAVMELHNFDAASVKYLQTNNEPTRNAFKNFRWVEDGIPLRKAKDRAKGSTTLVVAAGPSLNSQWEDLVRIQKLGATVIVAGRSYKQAMKKGLIPDFVVEVEQFEWDDGIFMFAPEPPEYCILSGPLTACPGLFHAWPARKMIMIDHNTAALFGWKQGVDSIDGGNSILHHMFNLAAWLGSGTILLAGADLSYPKGTKETHADGTFHGGWPKVVDLMERNRQDPFDVECTSGGTVTASKPYKNFCTFLEIQIQRLRKTNPGLKVINLSPHGQKINGTEFQEISTWSMPSSEPLEWSRLDSYSSPVPSSSPGDSLPTPSSNGGTTPALPVFDTTLTRQEGPPSSANEAKPS